MHFCQMIRDERQKKYSSSKEFYESARLSCSYYHYTKIEAGTVPDIKLAVEVLRSLKIPIRKGMYCYLQTEMPDKASKAIFIDPGEDNFPGLSQTLTIQKSIVLNPSQIEMLKSNPVYLELTLFLACHAQKRFNQKELANHFKLSVEEIQPLLSGLLNHGLIHKKNDEYSTKDWIYTPEDEAFIPLKEATIKRALDKYCKQPNQDKWQKTVTKLVSPEQKQTIENMLESVCSAIVGLPEPENDARPITIGIFSSWRSFGND